jgi:hypothetical protein
MNIEAQEQSLIPASEVSFLHPKFMESADFASGVETRESVGDFLKVLETF